MNNDSDTLRIYGLVPDSIVDGPGLRYSIFVQGCTHGCPGCHNPESHDASGGELHSIQSIFEDIRSNKLIEGVTFSGGDPIEQAPGCARLAEMLKEAGYDIWVYTGYLYEDLLRMAETEPAITDLLESTDVLVDGPFIESKKSFGLDWRGSSNQRLIDMNKTRRSDSLVIWEQPTISYEPPANW